jgi:hypothetical protein
MVILPLFVKRLKPLKLKLKMVFQVAAKVAAVRLLLL